MPLSYFLPACVLSLSFCQKANIVNSANLTEVFVDSNEAITLKTKSIVDDPSWNASLTINDACPLFVRAGGGAGFGDLIEHYVFDLYIATLFQATLVLGKFAGPSWHHGYNAYSEAAKFLGADFSYNVSYITDVYQPLFIETSFPTLLDMHAEVLSGRKNIRCNTMLFSMINSCPRGWCDNDPQYFRALPSLLPTLRSRNIRHKCEVEFFGGANKKSKSNKRGSSILWWGESFRKPIVIRWHVRTGDICLHCDDKIYYENVKKLLNAVIKDTTHEIIFHSQEALPVAKKVFPDSQFYNTSQSFLKELCLFFTADIVITSGSSFFPLLLSFAHVGKPVLFEERRKEAQQQEKEEELTADQVVREHFYDKGSAILLRRGLPVQSVDYIQKWISSYIRH